jgi:hypothetical protein
MEVVGIIDVPNFSWVDLLLKCPEIIFAVLRGVLCFKNFSSWMLSAFLVFFIDCLSGGFGKALTVEIFTCYLRDVASISGDMLGFHVGIWASDPVLALVGIVAVLKSLGLEILGWWIHLIIILLVIWF